MLLCMNLRGILSEKVRAGDVFRAKHPVVARNMSVRGRMVRRVTLLPGGLGLRIMAGLFC